MLDLDALRLTIAGRLNVISHNGQQVGKLFGPDRPLGIYDGAIIDYFTANSAQHPITALVYIATAQHRSVADEVLCVILDSLVPFINELPDEGRERWLLWRRTAAPGKRLALTVPDDVAYAVMRPSIDYMMGHHSLSSYRTGILVGQLVAWFLGDPLMQEEPTLKYRLPVNLPEHIRQEYWRFVRRFVRTVYTAHGIAFEGRTADLAP